LQRWFTDQVAIATVPNSWSQQVTFAWGVGGSALLPVIPKLLDLQGSVLYGQGVGRYMTSQLPDAVIGPNGALTPVAGLSFLVGLLAIPSKARTSMPIMAKIGATPIHGPLPGRRAVGETRILSTTDASIS
jgi:hypothetical protein